MGTTIRQISEITGYSPATVSKALNNKGGVNSGTSDVIVKTAKKMGYFQETDDKIKRVRLIVYKNYGLNIDEIQFFPLMVDGFQKECQRQGIEVVVSYLDRRAEDFELQLQKLGEDRNTPVVITGTEIMEQDLRYLKNLQCPMLMMDYWHESMEFSGVLTDNEDAMERAVDYLVSKGHGEIGYLKGDFRIMAFRSREFGYWRGMGKHNLTVDRQYTVELPVTMDGACQNMKRYLEAGPKLPTAFVADNDIIALGAMKAMQESGIAVPDDVSVIGFDDMPFSAITIPGLTSMRTSKETMGKLAVKRIIELQCEKSAVRTKTLVCPELVERDSVKNINERQEEVRWQI
ncbi:LacI family DNA-binding transcriptional regulator [Lachnospiraceae bacterium 62-35]